MTRARRSACRNLRSASDLELGIFSFGFLKNSNKKELPENQFQAVEALVLVFPGVGLSTREKLLSRKPANKTVPDFGTRLMGNNSSGNSTAIIWYVSATVGSGQNQYLKKRRI